MAFNPLKRTVVEVFVEAKESKNLVQEIKTPESVNYKSEIFKLLKSTERFSREECIELTNEIDRIYN